MDLVFQMLQNLLVFGEMFFCAEGIKFSVCELEGYSDFQSLIGRKYPNCTYSTNEFEWSSVLEFDYSSLNRISLSDWTALMRSNPVLNKDSISMFEESLRA